MRRTENMKFDEQSDYDYSEGETSEDMKLQGNSLLNAKSSSLFSPQNGLRQPIEKQLEMIDPFFAGNNIPNVFTFINSLDKIANLRKEKELIDPDPDPIECVIFNMTRPIQYKLLQSDYINSRPPIFAWTLSTSSIDPKSLYSVYKSSYQNLRNQIRFVANCPPSSEKLAQISQIRRDIPTGRVIFQYVGFGYPTITSQHIYASDPLTFQPSPVTLKTIFSGLKPPSWYIFDCDNAAAVLPTFQRISKKNQEKYMSVPTSPIVQTTAYIRQVDWTDYYCMCATDVGEEIPIDTRLPRDLLSSILMSPVPTAILFHIIHYYSLSFPNPDELLSYIKNIFTFESHDHAQLSSILSATIDAIAAQTLPPNMFTKLFRKDKITSLFFRNFVLARYLLHDFNIHPQIYPQLPVMNRNPMWKQWTSAADLWITSTQTPRPPLSTDFFSSCLTSLQSLLKSNREDEATLPLLTVACHAPFSDQSCSHAFSLLARYASCGSQYASRLVSPFLYGQSAQRLTEFGPEAHHIVFLLLLLANEDSKLVTEISPLSDFSKLTSNLFNDEIKEETRGLICAFLVISLDRVKSVRQLICTKPFMTNLFNAMKKSGPFLLTWLLILIAVSFTDSPIEPALIQDFPLQLQIAAALHHDAYEVRASSVLALSSFLQQDDEFTNSALLLHVSTTLSDLSMHVRFALLVFVYKYLEFNHKSIVRFYDAQLCNARYDTYKYLISSFLSKNKTILPLHNFTFLAKEIDEIAKSNDFSKIASNLLVIILHKLSNDACQNISKRGQILYQNTLKMVDGKQDYEDEENEEDIPQLSSHLMQVCTSALFTDPRSKGGSITRPRRYTRDYGSFDINSAHLQLRAECNLPSPARCATVVPGGLSIAVACQDQVFRIYDETLQSHKDFSVGNVVSCCAIFIRSSTNVATLSDEGVCSIIDAHVGIITQQWCVEPSRAKENGFIHSKGKYLFIVRGNGRISAWDASIGLLLGEYSFNDCRAKVSAMYSHATMDGLVIVGFENGSVRAFDTRQGVEKQLQMNLDSKIVSITGSISGLIYCACENGRTLMYDAKTNVMNTCGNKYMPGISQFSVHKKDPFFVLSPPNLRPFVCRDDLSVTHELQSPVEPGSTFVMSEEYPVVFFFGHSGDVHSYNLIQ